MNVPENLKYSKDHEWVRVEDNIAVLGISEFAQGELGDIVFVDVDPDLEEIEKDQTFGAIEAVKTVSDLLAPCSGKVLKINPKLEDEPELINSDPYGDGWIIKIELSNADEVNELLSSVDYQSQITA